MDKDATYTHIHTHGYIGMAFPGGSDGKESAWKTGDTGSVPGLGRASGEESGNPLCVLAWRIPRTEEPGGPQSTGWQRVGHDWTANTRRCE